MTEQKAKAGRIGWAEIAAVVIIFAGILWGVLTCGMPVRRTIIVVAALGLTVAYYYLRVTGRRYPMWYKIAAGGVAVISGS